MKSKQQGSITLLLTGIIFIALLAGVYLFITNSDDNKAQNKVVTEETQESSAENNSSSEGSEKNNYEEVGLEAVGDQTGEAVASRFYIDDVFTHELTVQTTEPPEGKFYEGWLVGDRVVSTGKLEKNSEGVWYLKFTSSDDLSNHNSIVITEETEAQGLDGKPERHIFEGKF